MNRCQEQLKFPTPQSKAKQSCQGLEKSVETSNYKKNYDAMASLSSVVQSNK